MPYTRSSQATSPSLRDYKWLDTRLHTVHLVLCPRFFSTSPVHWSTYQHVRGAVFAGGSSGAAGHGAAEVGTDERARDSMTLSRPWHRVVTMLKSMKVLSKDEPVCLTRCKLADTLHMEPSLAIKSLLVTRELQGHAQQQLVRHELLRLYSPNNSAYDTAEHIQGIYAADSKMPR